MKYRTFAPVFECVHIVWIHQYNIKSNFIKLNFLLFFMSELKNVQPLADFNWDEFENGSRANVSKQDLEQAYDGTLN